MGNKHLHRAKGVRNDEYYTQLTDIETELGHYRHHFKNKHIYCNCDNPGFSKFWEYFHTHFSEFGLKQLTATYYDRTAFVSRYDYCGGDDADISDAVLTPLTSHGDFRSPQCTAIMKEADIVITNPPYSLMQQFVVYLNKYAKDFIFIGPMNTVHYKEVFPYIKSKRILCGVNSMDTNDMRFLTDTGDYVTAVAWWFTTLVPDIEKPYYRFTTEYDPGKHPHYENYDAVDVSKTAEIPDNYYDVIGIALSFLKQLNYNQFDLIDISKRGPADMSLRTKIYTASDAPNYCDLNASAVLVDANGERKSTYDRLLIKRKR